MSTWNSRQFNQVPWNGPAAAAGEFTAPVILFRDDRTAAVSLWDDRTHEWGDMAVTGVHLTDKVSGNPLRLLRTYTDLPTGITFTKVYLTVKRHAGDADADAIVQKSITTSAASAGQITDASTSGGSIAFYFDLLAADTILLRPGTTYYFDFTGIASDSASTPSTFEIASITPLQGHTDATS